MKIRLIFNVLLHGYGLGERLPYLEWRKNGS